MGNIKATTQNLDSKYMNKVEERKFNERTIHHSTGKTFSIESNTPKVTRYFLRNSEGEPKDYIERQIIQNLKADALDDDVYNLKYLESRAMSAPQENQQSEQSHVRKYNKIDWPELLGGNMSEQNKNFGLQFTPSCSVLSERTFAIKHKTSTSGTVFERTDEENLTIASPKPSTKKPQLIFCKDPDYRLKNLFTIMEPNAKSKENTNFSKSHKVDLLSKTKDRLIRLIDEELQKIETSGTETIQTSSLDKETEGSMLTKLKLECIRKIEDELRLMKRLTNS